MLIRKCPARHALFTVASRAEKILEIWNFAKFENEPLDTGDAKRLHFAEVLQILTRRQDQGHMALLDPKLLRPGDYDILEADLKLHQVQKKIGKKTHYCLQNVEKGT